MDRGKQDVIEDATAILFDEYRKMSEAGLPHPRISIFIGVTGAPEAAEDGRLQKKADQVWEMYAGNPRYREMMQLHEGKPLLVVYVDTPSPWRNGTPAWDDERFAVRWMTGYVSEQAPCGPTTGSAVTVTGRGRTGASKPIPSATAGPESMVICAAVRPQGKPGDTDYIPAKGRRDGATLREQFARARAVGPRFAMVVSWNEWTTRRAAQHRGQQGSGALAHAGRPLSETAEGGNTPVQNRITRYPNQLPKTILP